MNEIKLEIEKRLNTSIVNEVENENAIAFEVRFNKKIFTFYSLKNENLRSQLLAFIYRIEKVL